MVLDVMASECHRTLKKCVLGGVLSSVHQLEKFPEVRQNERRGVYQSAEREIVLEQGAGSR